MPQLQIQLPCKASELTEAIRGFCEQYDGRYDLANVDVQSRPDPNSFNRIFSLEIKLPQWLANKENGEMRPETDDELVARCTYWHEMEYSAKGRSHVLARGTYNGLNFLAVNNGGLHPCGYVNVAHTALNGKCYDAIDIDCHGGLTFSDKYAPITYEAGWWLGWDYAHLGDYNPLLPYTAKDRRYDTVDVVRDCVKVIQQIGELLKKGGEA